MSVGKGWEAQKKGSGILESKEEALMEQENLCFIWCLR